MNTNNKSIVIITANFATGGREYKVGERFRHHEDGRNGQGWIAITNDNFEFSTTIPDNLCIITSEYELKVAEKLKILGII